MLTNALVKVLNIKSMLESKIKNTKGMEMLQLVILIAIAITLGGIVFYFLQTYFQGDFWDTFGAKMNAIFSGTGQS